MKQHRNFSLGVLAVGVWGLLFCYTAARAQTCGTPAPPKIEITGTSLGDNININPGVVNTEIGVYWTPYFPTDHQCGVYWILDDGVGPGYSQYIVNSIGGPSSCPAADTFTGFMFQSNWINETCKHTLKLRLTYSGLTGCPVGSVVYVDSNPVTLWIDGSQSPPHEDQDYCTGGAPRCEEPEIGRPINLANGRMHHDMVDVRIDGPLPIEFARRFDSGSTDPGPMGYGWQHAYMMRLTELNNEARKTLIDQDMHRVSFNCAVGYPPQPPTYCTGQWETDSITHLTLTEETVGTEPRWRVKDKHGLEWDFDSSGRLTAIIDRNGNTITLGYTGNPLKLTSISDAFGRGLTLQYDAGGTHVQQVSGGGRTVSYTYVGENLSTVTHSDLSGTFVTYTHTDLQGQPGFTATDAIGHVIESHTYSSIDGRVTDTQSADGDYSYHIDYVSNTQTNVTNARVQPVTTTFTILPHRGVAIDRTGGPGCSSCGDAGDRTQKVYDDNLNVTGILDGEGDRTDMTYDTHGNLLTRTEAANSTAPGLPRTTTITYDGNAYNLPHTITVPGTGTCSNANRVTTLNYDSNGNMTSEQTTGCNGNSAFSHIKTFTYDSHGQIASFNGPRDDSTDVLDKTIYDYYPDSDQNVPANNWGRLKRITDALGHQTTFAEYDLFGNVGSVTDPNDVKTSFLYDFLDHVTEKRIVGVPDEPVEDNIVTVYGYDAVGNLTSIRLPNCVAFSGCAYSRQYGYDMVNRLQEVDDPFGNKVIFEYDKVGNRTREEIRDSSSTVKQFTNFAYDNFNRLKYVYFTDPMTPPGPIYHDFTYFADGTRHTERDPMNHTTTFEYDALKRLTAVKQIVNAVEQSTLYDYDRLDGLKLVTDPSGLQTTYTNSDMGWRLSTASPDTGTASYAYDPAGNQVSSTDANSNVSNRAYDSLNRLTTVSYPANPSLNVTHSYDSGTATFGIGRRTRLVDPSGITTFDYDLRGLLTKEQKTMSGTTWTTQYAYDNNGNLTQVKYPTDEPAKRQGQADFTYDEADRVFSVTAQINGSTVPVADTFTYKPFGPRTSMKFGNTLVDARSFGTRYQIGSWTLGGLLSYTHTFDDDLNLTNRTDNLPSPMNRTFGYDEIHRLTFASGPWGAGNGCGPGVTYTYDKNGNRQCKGETGTATTYAYTAGTNRLASETTGPTTTNYSPDLNGNTIGDGAHTYKFSEANRIATVDPGPTPRASYTYDGDGRRAIKTFGPTTTYFYDPSGKLLTEVVVATGMGKDYLYLQDAPIARVDWTAVELDLANSPLRVSKNSPNTRLDWSLNPQAGNTYLIRRKQLVNPNDRSFVGSSVIATRTDPTQMFDDPVLSDGNRYYYRVVKRSASDTLFFYHTDHLGTPIAMTFGSSAFVWKAELGPFGDDPSPSPSNNLRFPGQYFDSETGLHQNWFRDYAPKTGRYVEADPLGLSVSENVFAYVGGDPIMGTDVFGLSTAEVSADRHTITIYWDDGRTTTYPVGNRTTNPAGDPNVVDSHGPAPSGIYPVQPPVSTAGDIRYGSWFWPIGAVNGKVNGKDVPADIARQRGIGLHCGRRDRNSVTFGCFRFDNSTCDELRIRTKNDPLWTITIPAPTVPGTQPIPPVPHP